MKNIDKIKQMTSEELVKFMKSAKCDRCSYNGTNCQHDMCTEGMTQWLDKEVELTIDDISSEYYEYCYKQSCSDCDYLNKKCHFDFMVDRFNIIDGKITRR